MALERQFADFVFAQLDMKVPALKNEENAFQVKEVQTLIEQLRSIIDASLEETPKPQGRRPRQTRNEATNA